ncbi:MAG: NPCBM/NEW2 domain-containing protein [Planctomycetota bacterium]
MSAARSSLGVPLEDHLVLETLAGKLESRGLGTPDELHFSAAGTVFLRYEGQRPPTPRVSAAVDLSDGQRWCGDVAGGSGDKLRWQTGVGPELELSIDHVTRIEFFGRVAELDRAALEPAAEGDRLYWAHGSTLERVDGTFEAFSDQGIALESVLGKRNFPWSEVGALFIAPLEPKPPIKPEGGVPLILDLVDGSRLRAGFQASSATGLVLRYPGVESLVIPFNRLIEAALDDGSFAYLSAIKPARAQEGSLFGDDLGLRWPHRVDQSVVGTLLSVGGQAFTRGLGVHAPSRLEWDLAPRADSKTAFAARELIGVVGVDDSVRSTAARGSVRFQVLVDGVSRWDSGTIRGGEPARAMPRIDLHGAKQLALVVEAAEDSFVADRADWLRLILVREP